MYETKNAFENTENRRVRLALIPAVFGDEGSSPLRVTSTGYKPILIALTEKRIRQRESARTWLK